MKASVDSFLNHLVVEKGFSRNTLEAYRNDLYQLIEFVDGRPHNLAVSASTPSARFEHEAWGRVGLDLLTDYVSSLKGKKSYRDTTTARKVAALKSFFNFLVQEEAIKENPAEFLTSPRVGRSLPKFLSEEEVESLLKQAEQEGSPDGVRDWAILEMLYATGLRVSELVSLDVKDVNVDEGYIRCMGKGSKERLAYMYPRAVQALRAYIEQTRPKFVSSAGAHARPGNEAPTDGPRYMGKSSASREQKALFLNQRGDRLTRQWVWSILKTCAQKADLNKPITPHVLRHSFATHMLRGGASLRHLQGLLGHSSITTTQVYTHLTTEHLRQEYDRSHPRS